MPKLKQPNKANVTLARMKMDSSRIHAYCKVEFTREGFLKDWVPGWLAVHIWWDAVEGRMYYRAEDGDRVVIPNGHYVVQMPAKWPLVISPSGFEADWLPLSPGDDGYDVLATDNAITRSDESHSLEQNHGILATNTDPSLRDEAAKRITRSSTLAERAPESTPSSDRKDDSALARGFEALDRYAENESNLMNPVNGFAHSLEDTMEFARLLLKLPEDIRVFIKKPHELTAEGLRRSIEFLTQMTKPESESTSSLSEDCAASISQHPSESQMQRDDRMYEQGYHKGFIHGQEILSKSIREIIRQPQRDDSQRPESKSGGSSGEAASSSEADFARRLSESRHEQHQVSIDERVGKPRSI
jgi:hypothetical protein